jgi:hypothetical protein
MHEWLSYLFFVLKRAAIIEVIVLAGVGLVCLVAGWHSVNEISMALLIVGVIIFSIGPFSMMGGWGNTRNWQYQYVQSMRSEDQITRMREHKEDMQRNIGLIGPSLIIGTITIIASVAFQTAFR